MSKTTTSAVHIPEAKTLDPEVLAFRQAFDGRSPLDELVHEGARRMLQAALDAEVDTFIETHQDRRDSEGRRLVVKNGSLPAREILTGAGAIQVKQRTRSRQFVGSQRASSILAQCVASIPTPERVDRGTDSLALPQRSFHE